MKVITRAPKDGWLLLDAVDCPLREQHTRTPSPLEFDEWAAKMAQTHRQMRCAGCHRWVVWVRYGDGVVLNGIDAQVIATGRDPR